MATAGDGNVRAGFLAGGGLLVFLGLGLGLFLNLLLHALAPSHGFNLYVFRVYQAWGDYATLVALGGILATVIGTGMIWLGFQSPMGPLSLPDTETPPQ